MNTLRCTSFINKCVPCFQRAIIRIVNTMTSGGSNVADPFVSPFSMKEFHGKGCMAKPRKRRSLHTKKNKHLTDRLQLFTSRRISTESTSFAPLDKAASPVTSRRSKGKRNKSTRQFKSPSEDGKSASTTSPVSPIFGPSYRPMMHKGVKQAWEDKNNKKPCRSPLTLKGKDIQCSIISMDYRAGIKVEPFVKSYRRYYHSRPTNVEDVGKELGRGRFKHVIVMSGAGISTPSGIPDFRLVSYINFVVIY